MKTIRLILVAVAFATAAACSADLTGPETSEIRKGVMGSPG
jgi:hypothetical protein